MGKFLHFLSDSLRIIVDEAVGVCDRAALLAWGLRCGVSCVGGNEVCK